MPKKFLSAYQGTHPEQPYTLPDFTEFMERKQKTFSPGHGPQYTCTSTKRSKTN